MICPNSWFSRQRLLAALSLPLLGCSSADGGPKPVVSGDGPAVLVAGLVPTTEAYDLYVAALPDVPSGDIDYAGYREFSAADSYVYTHAGYVFVWEGENLTMRRFSVSDSLELVDELPMSFLGRATGASNHVFISESRAYSLATDLSAVLVWNPSTMEITGTILVDPLERPPGMESFAYWGRGDVVGNRVVWEIVSVNYDAEIAYPATTLAIADAETEEPVRFIEDSRCTGGGGAHVDARGDYYVRAGALWGQFAALGPEAENVRTCVLRMRSGTEAFDADYLVDFRELTGSYVNYPWFHVAGSQYVAHAWDADSPLPADSDEFYATDATTHYRQLLVDLEAGTATPYPYLEGGKLISSDEFKLDGVSYYQHSTTGYVASGSTDVVELRSDGVVPRFHMPGSLWAFGRIR